MPTTDARERRSPAARRVAVRDAGGARDDEVVVEEPLAIRIGGDTLAVTMRTPGHDRELVVGFLLAEGVITSRDDLCAVKPCGRTGADERENTVEVTLAPGVQLPLDDDGVLARRGTIIASSCGVCGRRSIDDMLERVRPLSLEVDARALERATLTHAVRALRERQPVFARTGGCHAASLVTFQGAHVATFEDVGRHNAVDKVIGARVLAGALPLAGHALVVSGRSSFEIVQKAVAAGIPVVASVSAPSSLAVDLAERANVTLVGFVRGEDLTVYARGERLG